MVSTLNVVASALSALLFWTCLGAALTRRIVPASLALPLAPTVGWAVHSALALPIFRLVGFSQTTVLVLAALALIASVVSARGGVRRDSVDEEPRVPAWCYAAAALLALASAVAIMPKIADGGVILAGAAFDHAKIAMIDEMARLGVPPGNPFFQEGGGAGRLVYYYLWHFSAAELAVACGVSGWEADIAMTFVTAFASLCAMMGLAVRFAARRTAALWVIPLALSASLRPVLELLVDARKLDAVLLPGTGFAGWLFQSSWVPQHVMSANCVVVAAVLMSRLAERGILRILVVALVVAAAFECSTWIGGVTFALAGLAIGIGTLVAAEPVERAPLLIRLAIAGALTLCIVAPFVQGQLAAAAAHDSGAPVALEVYPVLGDWFPERLGQWLDLPAFWIVLLPVELPAIYLTGSFELMALLARRKVGPQVRRDALALALLGASGLPVSWLLASTLAENDDLGWRAVLPAVLVLTVFAAAGLAQWIASRRWIAVVAAVGAIALGLPRSVEIIRGNLAGHAQPDARAFAAAPELWDAVRRHSIEDERVGNNPLYLRAVTPWPVNISWALLADRRSCYAGREFALVFTAVPEARRDAIDAQFIRVFAGEGSADDVRDLATRYGCRVVALTPADGAWARDPFASSPFYRLVESEPERWRIYRAVITGDQTPRR